MKNFKVTDFDLYMAALALNVYADRDGTTPYEKEQLKKQSRLFSSMYSELSQGRPIAVDAVRRDSSKED
jgi:hypothetical protein